MTSIFIYDVAISFAGEDRREAHFIAERLSKEFNVFYDEYEKALLWGADLSEELPLRYSQSKFVLILHSDEYLKKMWTVLERQAIVSEFLKRRGKNYVLPIRVRGCDKVLPGVSDLTGYVTVKDCRDLEKIPDLVKQKLTNHT
jgi:hypothetical protein